MSTFQFALVADDWTLHRRSRRDIQRHDQRIKDAIKKQLPEIISRSDIISSDGQKIVKVPIKGMELPRFRFDPHNGQHVGQGDEGTQTPGQGGKGRTQPGTVIGKSGEDGNGKGAGDQPGQNIYETEITIDELVNLAFQELGLPFLENKGKGQMTIKSIRCDTIRKKGAQSNLDAKRTLIEAYKRNAQEGKRSWEIDPIYDPRYKAFDEVVEPEHNAVVLAMRDISGSMGEQEAYLCRTFFTWMVRFLRQCYSSVAIVFITCHTIAEEVDEDGFFHAGSSGGTQMASALNLCLDIIGRRYDPSTWNIYPFLFSDGDDFTPKECIEPVKKLLAVSNLFGYGEINDTSAWEDLGRALIENFKDDKRLVMVSLADASMVWQALKQFLYHRHRELAA